MPTDAPYTSGNPTDAPITSANPTDAPVTSANPTDAPITSGNPTDAPVTDVNPTDVPITSGNPTVAPATDANPTDAPYTSANPTDAPVTSANPTDAPVTSANPTDAPVTSVNPTDAPATDANPTDAPVTSANPTDSGATDANPAGNMNDGDMPGTGKKPTIDSHACSSTDTDTVQGKIVVKNGDRDALEGKKREIATALASHLKASSASNANSEVIVDQVTQLANGDLEMAYTCSGVSDHDSAQNSLQAGANSVELEQAVAGSLLADVAQTSVMN